MNKKIKLLCLSSVFFIASSIFAGCSKNSPVSLPADKKSQEVNIYSDRHYDTDKKLYEEFTNITGVKVNVVEGKSDELLERLSREGQDTQADVIITADAGRLYKAKELGLLQPFNSEIVNNNIPQNLRDVEDSSKELQ